MTWVCTVLGEPWFIYPWARGCLSLFSGVKNAWLSSSVSGALCTCGVMSLGYISKSGISGSQDMNIFRLVKQVPSDPLRKVIPVFTATNRVWECLALHLENMFCAVLCLVIQSFPTLFHPMDCSPPGSSVHGDSPGKNTGVGCHVLLQRICPTKGSNPGLPHCRQILYHMSR